VKPVKVIMKSDKNIHTKKYEFVTICAYFVSGFLMVD